MSDGTDVEAPVPPSEYQDGESPAPPVIDGVNGDKSLVDKTDGEDLADAAGVSLPAGKPVIKEAWEAKAPSKESTLSKESSKESTKEPKPHSDNAHGHHSHQGGILTKVKEKLQKYSIPLVSGVFIALIWANVDQESYEKWCGVSHDVEHPNLGFSIFKHPVTFHFIVNDIFMVFFFGIAAKEVTEALLPGGSLYPLKKAMNPLIATLGGVLGPVTVYLVTILIMYEAGAFPAGQCSSGDSHGSSAEVNGHRRLAGASGGDACREDGGFALQALLNGWGVPTATDISLAWMSSLFIFGAGHPSINYLLLLAVADDALGMAIIAIFYPNPDHPVEPVYLLLNVGAAVVANVIRRFRVDYWQVYVFIAGPLSWAGLLKAHVHPALALIFVVPFLPPRRKNFSAEGGAGHCEIYETHVSHEHEAHHEITLEDQLHLALEVHHVESSPSLRRSRAMDLEPLLKATHPGAYRRAVLKKQHAQTRDLERISRKVLVAEHQQKKIKEALENHDMHSPLNQFEHTMKFPVDLGMFFFGIANAGVEFSGVGGVTIAVLVALVIGKILGIYLMGLLAVKSGFQLPSGLHLQDLPGLGGLAGIGLTVALFVAGEAFTDLNLRSQAKMGALLSVFSVMPAYALKRLLVPTLPPNSHIMHHSNPLDSHD